MISSFKSKALKNYWINGDSSRIPSEMLSKVRRLLDILDNVEAVPQDFDAFKFLRLHPLKGSLKGYWSIDVTANYRLIFKFESKNVLDVDLVDTH